ncbi:MAG: hypothetical protein LBH04_11885 [Tannerellaceae bacterium]|nr:hypothetical protein [Tannerellaceae bacterium]
MSYEHHYGADFALGIRYEYALTDKLRLGLNWSNYNRVEQDMAGISICRTF